MRHVFCPFKPAQWSHRRGLVTLVPLVVLESGQGVPAFLLREEKRLHPTEDEWAERHGLTLLERWQESSMLWPPYLTQRGSLDPEPDTQGLSSIAEHLVRCLLTGGQARVFCGAAEFRRVSDFAILADAENLARLRGALSELEAGVIAVPPMAPARRHSKDL